MHRLLAVLTIVTGCTSAPNESVGVAAINQEIEIDEDCPITGCGLNAGFIKGVYFADLNFNAIPNAEGVVLAGFQSLPPGAVRLDVWKNQLVALGPPPSWSKVAEGMALQNSKLNVIVDGAMYPVTIAEVHVQGSYWAKKGVPDYSVVSYKFQYVPLNTSIPVPLCLAEPSLGNTMQFDAVVFEGERYEEETKNVKDPTELGWFNIACLSGAVGKTHMMRRTKASSDIDLGFTTSPAERQAMIRAWTADYCGGGKAFTTTGTPLRMRDRKKWIPSTSGWSWSKDDVGEEASEMAAYEAIWNENGAVCLNTPRKFGTDDEANKDFLRRIQDECLAVRNKELLPCSPANALPGGWETRGYFLTAIPKPEN